MDIIDIMLARAMTPQGQTETYVSIANSAATKAEKAKEDAAEAIATINAAAEDIADTQSAAEQLLADAQEALETAQAAQINTLDTEDVDAEVKKMTVNTNTVSGQAANTLQVITTYPDNTLNTQNITKLYKSTGSNEDGTMTQKAITDALATKADTSTVATKQYVNQQISNITITGGGGNTNLGSDNSGKIVIVGADGNIVAGAALEEEIIQALITMGGYTARDAVGIEIDYDNKTVRRTQEASGKTMGADFDSYIMYGGRMRCNVSDDGIINAFYGENEYTEDGSNGQVMIYQPKFYYQRVPLEITANKVGKIITRDSIMVSYTPQSGFKLHPLFKDANGEELDYVLLSAYEGGLYDVSTGTYSTTTSTGVDFNNDKMTSIAGTKPITGSSGLTFQRAEQLAKNRGIGWHIFTIEAESASQMLEVVEFGSLNGQEALGSGISSLAAGENNIAALSGATASLGNASGVAISTTLEANGSTSITTDSNKSAISYRGLENPWGNVWQMLGGILIYGNVTSNGGVPYICKNFNYGYTAMTEDYESAGFSLPNNSGWISALGYGERKYDWLLMPAAADNANSALPIGDNGWFDSNMNGLRMVVQGGGWSFEQSDGPFYYGCDKQPIDSTYKSYGARLLFIPTKNEIYTANIDKWEQEMNIGG